MWRPLRGLSADVFDDAERQELIAALKLVSQEWNPPLEGLSLSSLRKTAEYVRQQNGTEPDNVVELKPCRPNGAGNAHVSPGIGQGPEGLRQEPGPEPDLWPPWPPGEPKPDVSDVILPLADWLKRELEPADPVLGEWLTTTSRAMMFAPTGEGKTMLAIAIGMRVAAGLGFLHWKRQGSRRVLFIDGEMPRRLLKARLADEARRIGMAPESIPLFCLSHEDIPNFAPLDTPEGRDAIDKIIADRLGGAVDLVIFDNIMSLVSGDMKEEEGWRRTLPWQHSLTHRKIGQLWIHHTGHDESRSYGTKTKEWQMDTVLKGEPVKREGIDVSLQLTFRKARERTPMNRRDFADVLIALVGDIWEYKLTDPAIAKHKVTPTAKKFMDALLNCSLTERDGVRGVTFEDWQRECVRLGLIEGGTPIPPSARSMMSKYRRELVASNWIACNDDMAWKV